jgi:hypothetical protein
MQSKEKVEMDKSRSPLNVKKLGAGAGILIAVFLLGYVPSCVTARNIQEKNARIEYKLKMADLHGKIGMASYEANRNNYASAAQFSTEFFNGLQETINTANDVSLRQKLAALLARRDELTTNLAQADPVVKEKLAGMYADFFQINALPESNK